MNGLESTGIPAEKTITTINLKQLVIVNVQHLTALIISTTFYRVCFRLTWVYAALAVVAGCNSFGPNNLRGTHPLYNEAIVTTMNEQLLLNIVRSHYRDPLFFLNVANVTATMKLDLSAGLDQSSVDLNGGEDLIQYSFGAAYTTSPTISYAPLQGEGFFKSILRPIPIEAIFSLSSSGWRASRVFGLCLERINNVENAPSASGPTPRLAPEQNRQFNRLLQLIEEVNGKQILNLRINAETKQPQLEIRNSVQFRNQVREIKALLGLDQNLELYRIESELMSSRSDTLSIRTRSLNSIFFYLSHHVELPQTHKKQGLVTVTRNPDNSEFDWGMTAAGNLFHILVSEEYPDLAFLAIPYRGH